MIVRVYGPTVVKREFVKGDETEDRSEWRRLASFERESLEIVNASSFKFARIYYPRVIAPTKRSSLKGIQNLRVRGLKYSFSKFERVIDFSLTWLQSYRTIADWENVWSNITQEMIFTTKGLKERQRIPCNLRYSDICRVEYLSWQEIIPIFTSSLPKTTKIAPSPFISSLVVSLPPFPLFDSFKRIPRWIIQEPWIANIKPVSS